MIPVFYCDQMVADIASFSPSAGKPREVVASWQALGIPMHVRLPEPVLPMQLYLAHDPDYVDGVLAGKIVNGFGNRSQSVAKSLPWTTGAMLSAAREAMVSGRVAVAPCSGFHHADYATSCGFCTFNGLMVTATVLLDEGCASSVGILDCDMHYGDGTDAIRQTLCLTDEVKHFSAGEKWHNPGQAVEFLRRLPSIVESFAECDVLLYQAGADPHIDDPLGGWMTTEQLAERDGIVFGVARRLGLPVAWNLAGGYMTPLRRVLDIHDHTMMACIKAFVM